jgi:hypothetical protein
MLYVVTRLGIALIALLAAGLIPDSTHPPPYHLRSEDNLLLDVFGSRWDTGFYVSIAEEGYRYRGVPLPSVAFFPLMPLLMRTVTPLTGDAVLSGILVSHLALFLATFIFYRMVVESWGQSVADRAVWYWLIFPTAFFGSAIYTEALFLLVAVGSFYFARRGFWELAAIFGIAASLTRLIGLVLAPVLLVMWIQGRRSNEEGDRPSWLGLLASFLTPLGTGAYMFYLWRAFGEPLAFMKGAAAWDRTLQSPVVTLAAQLRVPPGGWWSEIVSGRIHFDNWIDFSLVVLFALAGIALLLKHRWAEGLYVLSGLALTMSSGLLMSQRRYVWVLFPVFILLAQWGRRPWVDRLVTVLSLMGLALFTALFANGYWVG